MGKAKRRKRRDTTAYCDFCRKDVKPNVVSVTEPQFFVNRSTGILKTSRKLYTCPNCGGRVLFGWRLSPRPLAHPLGTTSVRPSKYRDSFR